MVKKLLNKTTWHCLLLLVLLSPAISFGQVTIFTENMGSPSATTAISANTFQNTNPIVFSGTADVRTTTPSNYTNASAGGNIFFTTTSGRYFEIGGINTTSYTNIALSFGHYKSNTAATSALTVQYSTDGTNYTNVAYSRTTTSATWEYVTATTAIPAASNVRLRFTTTSGSIQFRVDDVKLTGTPPSPTLTTTVATAVTQSSATSGGSISDAGSGTITAKGVVWNTSTAPTIALTTKTNEGTGTSTYTSSISSLNSNTRYYYRAYATNSLGGTGYGTEYNFYTAAAVPGTPTLGNPQQTSIDVTVNATGNNAATTYAIRVNGSQYVQANGTLGASPVYQTAANWGTKTITGLTAGTTYTVDVAAQNTDATLVSAYGSSASIDTLAATAPSLTLTASSLSFGNVCINATTTGTFTFEGANIVGTTDITVPAISGFSYSLTANGTYTNTLTITNYSGASVTVYVKFTPTVVQSYGGTVNVAGTGANATAQFNITTSGAGINTLATITTVAGATNITGFTGTISATYTTGCYTPTALEFEYSTASFTSGTGTVIVASTTTAGGYSAVLSGLAPSTRYYFKAKITDASGTYYGFQNSFVTNGIDAPVATAATNVATNSFTANWNTVSTATYQLDLSTNPTFGTGTRATDLFFSEYVEGSSNNKYIEIYNGTGNTVDLSNYKLSSYANGSATAGTEVQLSGALLDGQTKVYKNSAATAYAGAAESNSAINFNGDDAIALIKISTGAYVDIIGSIGYDPGTAWTSGSFSTLDKTLRRKATVTSGLTTNPATSFPTLSTEWEVSATDDVTNLGSHTFSSWTPSYVTGYQNIAVSSNSLNAATNIADNTTYYYRVRTVLGNSISVNSNVISVTTPIGNVTWTVPSGQSTATWVPAATPTSDINVTLNANYDTAVNGNITAKNLTLNNGYNLAVAPNTTVTVYGNIVNNAQPNNFVVENNGSLVQYGNGTATGAITVNKNSNPLYLLDYTLWSSPVNGAQTLQDFSPNTVSSRFYEYKYALNSSNTMVEAYFHVDAASTFTPANGYLIRMPNQNAATGYNEGTAAITYTGLFTGTPNTGTITKAMNTGGNRYTGTGNPYASPISVVDFFTQNASVLDPSSGIYLWRKKNSAASASYATLTLAGFTSSGATYGGEDQQSYFGSDNTLWTLAPGQGFIVRTSASATGNPVVTFTNSMRRSASASGQAFFRQAGNSKSRYWMSLKGTNGAAAQMAVAYLGGATTGIDAGYDGTRYNDNKIAVYTLAENTELAIQARPAFEANDTVKLGYLAETAGTYTLTLDNKDGVFANGQDVFIYDTAEGLVYNMANGGYTFTTEAGTFNNRFEILYTTQALGADTVIDANAVAVYKSGTTIYANTGNAIINAITVYDIRGRKLYENNNVAANTTTISTLSAAQEVIIVQLKTNKGTVSKKIVF